MLHGTALQGWTPNNMDVYAPITSAKSLVRYLEQKEGYEQVPKEGLIKYEVVTRYSQAIDMVIEIQGPKGQKMDIVCSSIPTVLYLIPFF